mmetsp:Transcript_19003/g.35441  ORF Transcript_19003/g.35441 Transcript_19003/m.35441 type:complete len:84 (+) Transcript_19003:907-1158(+)
MHRRHSYEEHNDMPIELQTFRMGPRFRPEFQRMVDAMSLQCYQMLSIIGAPFVIKNASKSLSALNSNVLSGLGAAVIKRQTTS